MEGGPINAKVNVVARVEVKTFDIEDLVDFSINNKCIGAQINLFKPIEGEVLLIWMFRNSSGFLTKE
jgi:hypothetical protein